MHLTMFSLISIQYSHDICKYTHIQTCISFLQSTEYLKKKKNHTMRILKKLGIHLSYTDIVDKGYMVAILNFKKNTGNPGYWSNWMLLNKTHIIVRCIDKNILRLGLKHTRCMVFIYMATILNLSSNQPVVSLQDVSNCKEINCIKPLRMYNPVFI